MEVQLTSGQLTSSPGELACAAVETAQPNSGEDAARQALASSEGRERRRLEFRSSLLQARATLARGKGREMVEQSMRQLSAEQRERRPARMMAELANAH